MDEKNIIQQGTVGKYSIDITRAGYVMDTDDFTVILSWGMTDKSMTIRKSEMQHTDDGWIFIFPTDEMVGVVTASCEVFQPDMDMPDGKWKIVDRQRLCFVATTACPLLSCGGEKCGEHQVKYDRVYNDSSAHGRNYLVDVNYIPITADGDFLTVRV
jgi:hypothetical protein